MLSTKVPVPSNIKETIENLESAFLKLKDDFHQTHNGILFGENTQKGLVKLGAIQKKTIPFVMEINKLITNMEQQGKKTDPVLSRLLIGIAALRMRIIMVATGVNDERLSGNIEKELELEILKISMQKNPQVFADPSCQEDVYYLFLVKNEIEIHKAAQKKKNETSEVERLSIVIDLFSNSAVKLQMIRAFFVELAIEQPNDLYRKSQSYLKMIEESFKSVSQTQCEKVPETLDEYHKLLDVSFASFMYYQLWLVNSYLGYHLRNKTNNVSIIAGREALTADPLKLFPNFSVNMDEKELSNYVKKERQLRKELDRSLNLIKLLNFEKIPKNYRLIRRIGDVIEECRVCSLFQSIKFSKMLDYQVKNASKSSVQHKEMLAVYCQELNEISDQWIKMSEHYEKDCLKKAVNLSENIEKNKQYEKEIDHELAVTANARESVNDTIESAIKKHQAQANSLKKLSDQLFKEIIAAEDRRKKRHDKAKSSVKKQIVENSGMKSPNQMQEEPGEKDDQDGVFGIVYKADQKTNIVRDLEKLDERLNLYAQELLGRVIN